MRRLGLRRASAGAAAPAPDEGEEGRALDPGLALPDVHGLSVLIFFVRRSALNFRI